MTIYFVGGEMGAFVPSDSTAVESAAVSTPFNSSFARCALYTLYTENYVESPSIGSLTTAWIHMEFQTGPDYLTQSGTRFSWYDAGATERIRLIADNVGTMSLQYNVGAGWVTAGSQISVTLGGRSPQAIDINVVCNSASGSIKLYVAGTQRITSGTINLSAITALDKFRFSGFTNAAPLGTATYVSQVIVADEPTIGWRLKTVPATGAGATIDWTGTYTEIDEIVHDDADFINSATNAQVELFTHTSTVPTGYTVRAVGVTARGKRGASGPANLQLALRSAGTTYFSSSKALDVGYGAHLNIWEQDPATSSDFTASAANAVQFGVKAIT